MPLPCSPGWFDDDLADLGHKRAVVVVEGGQAHPSNVDAWV
ncbi:hypothetical protein MGAST_28510 [Mycobacterium gastri 'Wayne']|nr:hypothetical protein MGAST_28510 [Mycobacterium gastri 'Wayne']